MKFSKAQWKWLDENAERKAEYIGIWHALGCDAFDGGMIEKCTCGLRERIGELQEEANLMAGL